jgi:low molecular weight protein-tyrosine phosphatase
MTSLPAPRVPGRYRITLVCLGNICRSPMAEVVLAARVAEAGLAERVEISSSGTGDWHVGDPMDRRAATTLTTAGYDATRHRARHLDAASLAGLDLVLVMDAANLADVRSAVAQAGLGAEVVDRIRLFREFDPAEPGGEVPDPYYGGPAGFEEVLAMVERTAATVVAGLHEHTTGTTAP